MFSLYCEMSTIVELKCVLGKFRTCVLTFDDKRFRVDDEYKISSDTEHVFISKYQLINAIVILEDAIT